MAKLAFLESIMIPSQHYPKPSQLLSSSVLKLSYNSKSSSIKSKMVQIFCTGPVQEWPSDDSDFELENLPGYKKGATSWQPSSSDDSDDSDYKDESSPLGKKRRVTKSAKKAKEVISKTRTKSSSSNKAAVAALRVPAVTKVR